MSANSLESRVRDVCKSAYAVNTEITLLAEELLAHWVEHGDHTLISRLCAGLPNGQRVKALCVWFETFSGPEGSMNLKIDRKTFAIKQREKCDRSSARLVEGASNPWDTFTTEKEPKPLDVAALVKYLTSVASPDPDAKRKIDPEAQQVAQALLPILGKHAARIAAEKAGFTVTE